MAKAEGAPLTIYLAGPDVFLADAAEVGALKRRMCAEFGFVGHFPLDNDLGASPDAAEIFQANRDLMRSSDMGVFNLTPFRGPSADVGTVMELGFMHGLGRPMFGYSSDERGLVERTRAAVGGLSSVDGQLQDDRGYNVEAFGLADNLMIDEAIRASGGAFVRKAGGGGDPLAALDAFRGCLEAIAAWAEQRRRGTPSP